MMKKYHLTTFGCQINQSDSERIASKLEEIGYQSASNQDEADLVVINMCSVRQSAVDRVYGRLQKIRKDKDRKYLLTGCMLKQDLRRFKQDFDYILPIKALPYWEQALEKQKYHYCPNQRSDSFYNKFSLDYFNIRPKYKRGFSAYIPVATGCDNFCSYCVVPYTRGPMLCRKPEDIVQQAQEAIDNKVKELWLVAPNVNSYSYKGKNFSELLQKIDQLPGNFWLNFTSSHPKDFSRELIETIKNGVKTSHYVSLPVQSGDNNILKKMNRPYTVEDYRETVDSIKKEIPDLHLSTDVIVGFPGETKKQFQNTVKLFKEIRPDMAYIAEYSPRPHTAACKMKDDVSLKEKQRRREVLTEVLEKIILKKNRKYIDTTVEVLVFKQRKEAFIGKTRNYKTVKITGLEKPSVGSKIKVKVKNAIPWGLLAHPN